MPGIRRKYDEEFKKDAVKLSYHSSKTVRATAEDLGVAENVLHRWRQKYTMTGEKSKFATLEEENRALQRELSETRIERDMLKNATAYFASLRK